VQNENKKRRGALGDSNVTEGKKGEQGRKDLKDTSEGGVIVRQHIFKGKGLREKVEAQHLYQKGGWGLAKARKNSKKVTNQGG